MKQTLILMYANRKLLTLLSKGILFSLLLALPFSVLAATSGAVHDPHQLASKDDFQETVESRCTICHTRDRIDKALEEGENLDALLQRMIERGAIVNDRDKSVLGTFWGSPTSGDKKPEQ